MEKGNEVSYSPDCGYFAPFTGYIVRSVAFIVDLLIIQVAVLSLSLLPEYLVTQRFGLPEPPFLSLGRKLSSCYPYRLPFMV